MVSIDITETRMISPAPRVHIAVFGTSLSAFLALSYVLCIVGYLVAPGMPVKHEALSIFLPGFELLSWRAFFLGLAESYAWGWYIAVGFGLIYNFVASRVRW
jgi:2TM family of unknown function (DUF5676)